MIVFFIPYGLITAELGSAWPGEGGVYVWVREAFGPKWGSTVAWLYWINNATWIPVGLPDLRRHLLADVPEDPLDVAGGRDRHRPDVDHGRRRCRPPRGLEVGAEPRRGGQGPDLPRARGARAVGAPPRAAAVERRSRSRSLAAAVERHPRVSPGAPLLDFRLRADELGRRGDAAPETRRADRDLLVGRGHRGPLLVRHRRDPLRGADREAVDRHRDLGRARRPRKGVGPRGGHGGVPARPRASCTRASPTSSRGASARTAWPPSRPKKGMLPAALGRLHPRFRTPYLAFVAMGFVSTGLLVGGASSRAASPTSSG